MKLVSTLNNYLAAKRGLFVFIVWFSVFWVIWRGEDTLTVAWVEMEASRDLYLSVIISHLFFHFMFDILLTVVSIFRSPAENPDNPGLTYPQRPKETYAREGKSDRLTAPALSSPYDSGSGALTCVSVVFHSSSKAWWWGHRRSMMKTLWMLTEALTTRLESLTLIMSSQSWAWVITVLLYTHHLRT